MENGIPSDDAIIKNQKRVNSIFMNLHPVRSASVPDRKRTSLPSEVPAEHLTVGKLLAERRKIDEEKITQGRGTTEAQRSSPCPKKSAKRAKKSVEKVENK